MKIEVWSDFVCPFCYMGKRHVELAKAQLPQNFDIQITYRSFELDPKRAWRVKWAFPQGTP